MSVLRLQRWSILPRIRKYTYMLQDARGDQCDGCSRTLDAIELINPRCVDNASHKVITKASTHMYLRLDVIQPRTEEWIRKSWKAGKWSPNAVVNSQGEIIDARLKGGLRPSAITRDLRWGVPVPAGGGEEEVGTEGKVICELLYARHYSRA